MVVAHLASLAWWSRSSKSDILVFRSWKDRRPGLKLSWICKCGNAHWEAKKGSEAVTHSMSVHQRLQIWTFMTSLLPAAKQSAPNYQRQHNHNDWICLLKLLSFVQMLIMGQCMIRSSYLGYHHDIFCSYQLKAPWVDAKIKTVRDERQKPERWWKT